jgi:hypothetical protein
MTVDNTQDVIDSRDVIERIEELEIEGALRASVPGESWGEVADRDAADYLDDDDAKELRSLRKLAEAAENAADWQYGETLIRDSYFTEYTRELIADCYTMPKDFDADAWPWRHMKIDYEAAAGELQSDYFDVEFDGITYWIR